jgi:hypothetical protein
MGARVESVGETFTATVGDEGIERTIAKESLLKALKNHVHCDR